VTGIRRAGFDGEVVVLGREKDPPYQRPPLSKRYLLGEVPRHDLPLPPLDATLRLGVEVTEIDPERHEVRLAAGERLAYQRLLLATGSSPRRLRGHEADQRVMYLRELGDADRLREVLASGAPLEIVGAGFIGCEVAAVSRTRGLQVTVYEAFAQPLQRVLGPEVGGWLGEVHRARGVDLRTGVRELPAFQGWVLAAVGTEPRTDLAAAAGVACEAGVLVDARGRTDVPDVFAAGDCARFWSPLFEARVRVEHYQTAMRHGTAVGRVMAGDELPFAEAPWFWSDQYDLNVQYVGASLPWDRTVVRGRLGEPPFSVFYFEGERLRAAAGVNDGRTISQTRRLLEAGVAVASDELADPEVDLKKLVAERTA
jgi:3-phenylpropionate/trans-cinnamate dioxygenase ferredoxin reductase subunit